MPKPEQLSEVRLTVQDEFGPHVAVMKGRSFEDENGDVYVVADDGRILYWRADHESLQEIDVDDLAQVPRTGATVDALAAAGVPLPEVYI
jgi:hypothetical protein